MKEKSNSTVDIDEVERFSRIADEWWDLDGKFKPLHRINPLRIQYIVDQVVKHFRTECTVPSAEKSINSALPTQHSAPLRGLTLLDIGCGGGLIAEPMARLGATVTAIDASEKNIKVAGLHAERSGLTIDYRCTTAEDLLATGAQFDIVLSLEIVEHVSDIAAFVSASCGLLKPGGLTIWSTLNRTAKSFALAIVGAEYILRWLPKGTHTWNKFVKPSELCKELRKNGIEIVDMTGMVMNPLTFKWELTPRDLSVNYLVVGRKSG